jgi:hypothetical protein
MYSKHKISLGLNLEAAITDLLKKTKIGLIRVFSSSDFISKILSLSKSSSSPNEDGSPDLIKAGSMSPGRNDAFKEFYNPSLYLTQLSLLGHLLSLVG